MVKSPVGRAVAITALLYAIAIGARLARHHFDATFFITVGSNFCQQAIALKGLLIATPDGYDGQFYYRLALHPFTSTQIEDGIRIDNPPYRQQRILYPLLAHMLAFGDVRWVPWSMIVVNYLAVCVLAFSASRLAELFAIPAMLGLIIPFYPGVLLGLDRDLTDTLAMSLMVSSLYLLHSRRIETAAFVLAMAVLARETVVLFAAVLFAHSIWRAMGGRSSWRNSGWLMMPLATYGAWQLWIFETWGTFASSAGGDLLAVPFGAPAVLFIQAVKSAFGFHPFQLLELLLLGAMIFLAAGVLVRSAVDSGIKFAWLIYLLMAASLSASVWVEDWAFFRGCEELMVLSFIILMGARDRRLVAIAFVPTILIWLALAVRTVVAQ